MKQLETEVLQRVNYENDIKSLQEKLEFDEKINKQVDHCCHVLSMTELCSDYLQYELHFMLPVGFMVVHCSVTDLCIMGYEKKSQILSQEGCFLEARE